jgi:putative inorganic carbon (hco3(-)) transporter
MERTETTSRTLSVFCVALLVFWVVVPELRRLLDWRFGFHASQALVLVPLLSMGVFAFATTFRGTLDVSRKMLVLAWIWLGAFGYAFAVGWLVGRGNSAVYDFLQFFAPMFIALWLARGDESPSRAFTRLSTVILVIAVGVSAYGLWQFVALPPWDAYWMQQVVSVMHMASIGKAQPFEVRVFSVLNSPEPCGAFLALAVALNLYRLTEKRILPLAALLSCVIALALTLVRSAWIGLFVAIVVYAIFSARPGRAVTAILACAALVVGFFAFASPWIAEQAGRDIIGQRVQTFANLQNDSSAQQRSATTEELVSAAIAYPIGEGLGMMGTATQLSSLTQATNAIGGDGGLQARLVEMGFTGFVGYVAVVLLAFAFVLQRWWEARRSGDHRESEIMSVLLAVQASLIVLDLSVDSHVNLTGALFWLTVGIALSPGAVPATRVPA